MKRFLSAAVLIISFFVFVSRAQAVEFRSGESVGTQASDVIPSSLVISGSSVVVDGIVKGDVYCAGKSIVISGVVEGDVLCAGQNIHIDGVVKGNVRSVGQKISITGSVDRNINALAQSFTIDPNASVGGEVMYAGQTITIDGATNALLGGAQYTEINGHVAGDAIIYGQELSLGNAARIDGSLTYTSQKDASISQSATVSGAISHILPKESNQKNKPLFFQPIKNPTPWPANALTSVFFYTVLGLLTALLFSKKTLRVQQIIREKGVYAGIIGLVAIMGAPLVALILVVTIIGIFAIPFVVLAYILATMFGRIVVGQTLGQSILEGFHVKAKDNVYYQTLAGVPILWFMCKAPFVGGLISVVSILLGLGAVFLSFHKLPEVKK